jgi:mRNA interferase MazF
MKYKQRDIVLVPFPFSDLSSMKKRPVLIVSNNGYNENFKDVVVCVITSNQFVDLYSIPISDHDLELGILPEPSVIKSHKLFTIQKDQILKKFSTLSVQCFDKVLEKIDKLIKGEELKN